MTEVGTGLTNTVRRVLRDAGQQEARGESAVGFHVWISKQTSGTVFVEHRRNPNKFDYKSTNRYGNDQIEKFETLLKAAGFKVIRENRPGVDRLKVSQT